VELSSFTLKSKSIFIVEDLRKFANLWHFFIDNNAIVVCSIAILIDPIQIHWLIVYNRQLINTQIAMLQLQLCTIFFTFCLAIYYSKPSTNWSWPIHTFCWAICCNRLSIWFHFIHTSTNRRWLITTTYS
jgi:hypothetical protein